MADFEKAEPTNELRWHFPSGALQQKWRITISVAGAVKYSEEWRDVPEVHEK
jgi:hypothetical protein